MIYKEYAKRSREVPFVSIQQVNDESKRITKEFKDALANTYLSGLPKMATNKVWAMAWKKYEPGDWFEIEEYYKELAELTKFIWENAQAALGL